MVEQRCTIEAGGESSDGPSRAETAMMVESCTIVTVIFEAPACDGGGSSPAAGWK
ncbi:uncharacterized protein DS421_13g418790 [Arachis hypogaea]|nr:uncharacterized protein DS421_13g418790 [Arachis hypogaea]